MTAAIYTGHVAHTRLNPFRHGFRYRVFSLWLNLDDLAETAAQTRLFSYNRFNVIALHDKDHGSGDGSAIKHWVLGKLQEAGYAADERWTIRLLCFPRLWGYVFNPIAIYYCSASDDILQAIIYQVSNTFGERHSYILPANINTCKKNFHVSPFMPIDGHYLFKAPAPDEKLDVTIHYLDESGNVRLIARQTGVRTAFTSRHILKAVLSHPLITLKVTVSIHWQALKLWCKGAHYFKKPARPDQSFSTHQPSKALPL